LDEQPALPATQHVLQYTPRELFAMLAMLAMLSLTGAARCPAGQQTPQIEG